MILWGADVGSGSGELMGEIKDDKLTLKDGEVTEKEGVEEEKVDEVGEIEVGKEGLVG